MHKYNWKTSQSHGLIVNFVLILFYMKRGNYINNNNVITIALNGGNTLPKIWIMKDEMLG